MEKEYYDLAIIAPLEEEAAEIFKVFPPIDSMPIDGVMITRVKSGEKLTSAVVAQLSEMGNQSAYGAAKTILANFKIGLLVCVGIGGRVSDDLLLGDVCYTGTVIDVTERQKVKDAPKGKAVQLELSSDFYDSPNELVTRLNFLRTDPKVRASVYDEWQKARQREFEDRAIESNLTSRGREMFRSAPTSRHGKIACGPVAASKNFIAKLLEIDRKMLAIDTESGGVFKAAREAFRTPALTIRGISDFADPAKNTLEKATKGFARSLAAGNAISLLLAQLNNPYFLQFLRERKHEVTGAKTPDLFQGLDTGSPVQKSIPTLEGIVEQKLKELCPEYRMLENGYELPAPRLLPIRINGDPRASDDSKEYFELAEALSAGKAILADLPLSYPSESFPWVVCKTLLQAVIDEKQVFPIPINGKRVSPPKGHLDSSSFHFDFQALVQEGGALLVFVIFDFDLDSPTRTKFLLAELEKYPTAKALLISRGRGALATESGIVQGLGARCYSVGGIPFIAISKFLELNFSLPPVEAEVIAYRIHATFDRFKLSAHPTYFAAISREMLSALLQATRRSELIQLAVDGFLTLLVAEDADVPLSRTTRRRFLSELAVELAVEKRSFTEQQLKSFAAAFAERHDFEIDASKFVDVFVEKGIIRFEQGLIEFTLPFIKHYLLAVALSKDESLAARHFNLLEDEFDDQTFDLYSEIGPSQKIIDGLLTKLKEHNAAMVAVSPSADVLLSEELKPKLLAKYKQIADVRRSLTSQIKKLEKQSHDGAGKQELIDLGVKTAQEVGRSKQKTEEVSDDKEALFVRRAERDWRIGCILLGGAAEQLVSTEKKDLIGTLISLGSNTVDVRTRRAAKVDFSEVKERVKTLAKEDGVFEKLDSEKDREAFSKALDMMVDLFELAVLGQPFISTMEFLCEGARHRVLGTSIEKADVAAGQQQLIKAVWLTDIDAKKGLSPLRKSVTVLPTAVFLRILLATHFVERVYWAQWRQDQREALLDAAQETLKALGLAYPKDKMMRLIGREEAGG